MTKDPTLDDARSAFLDFVADADRFDEDCDLDGNDQPCIHYHITVNHFTLEQLAEAFGIEAKHDESILDAIRRVIEKES